MARKRFGHRTHDEPVGNHRIRWSTGQVDRYDLTVRNGRFYSGGEDVTAEVVRQWGETNARKVARNPRKYAREWAKMQRGRR